MHLFSYTANNDVEKDMTVLKGIPLNHPRSASHGGTRRSVGLATWFTRSGGVMMSRILLAAAGVICAGMAHATTVAVSGLAEGVAVGGGYAYVANGFNGVQVVDVSKPGFPVWVSSARTPDYAYQAVADGQFVYVAASGSGLQVVDVSHAKAPAIVGSADTPGNAYGVAVSGRYAYVADGVQGLQVIDVSNASAPARISGAKLPGDAQGVTVVGQYAYVADGNKGLQVVDISNPRAPKAVAAVNTPGDSKAVAVANGHAYVADVEGLQVIDVSNPKDPKIVGSAGALYDAVSVAAAGNYVYVGNSMGYGIVNNSAGDLGDHVGDGELQVIDVSNPKRPLPVGLADLQGNALGVAVRGDYAYVAQGVSGMNILDISHPSAPVYVKTTGGVVQWGS